MNNICFKKDIAKKRSVLYSKIRRFFDSRGYLEVETPILSPDLIPEPTIDNFSTMFANEFIGSHEQYLLPSPELYMKKLIAEGSGSIYQISKCFRNSEQIGSLHSPEFTMLEYYTVDFDEKDSIGLTLDFLKDTCVSDNCEFLQNPTKVISVRDAVMDNTGLDLDNLQSAKDLREAAQDKLALIIPSSEPWEDTFNRIFCTFVETNIPKNQGVIFTDYPAQINCLALKNGFYRRRWEMYVGSTELANCYAEETSVQVVRDYYNEEYRSLVSLRGGTEKVIPDCDPSYADIFENFPKCSGVAMGLDRLLMLETGLYNINDTLMFPFATGLE